MDKIIYGGDTETYKGFPMTLQFYSEDVACSDIFFVSASTAADQLFAWCAKRKPKCLHVVYIHNLEFDLVELLWGHHDKLVGTGGEFDFKYKRWNIKGVYGAPTFATIRDASNRVIMLVDSFSYFRSSLAKAADIVCPNLPKLKRVDGIGEKKFHKRDTAFCAYAMRDAEIAYHIGKAIELLHEEFDLQQCVSVADMAARIFKKKLTYQIPQPSRVIVDASLLSYHGGKNNVTVKAGWYSGVNSLDISSAYPAAMHALPAFSNEKLYKRYNGKAVKQVHPHGVYCVSGKLAECKWPVMFSHGFKPLSGDVRDIWVQGFELNEALRSGEFKPTKIRGHYYDSEKDHQASALRWFVEYFYEKKQNEKEPVKRFMYKLILNSVSGKFIQTRKKNTIAFTDIDAGVTVAASELVAGGLFHPFIASAITAHTRARIHELEHEFKAIHTATDGIMTQDKRAKAKGRGLGALTLEAKNANLLMVRNKCYVLYADKSDKTEPSKVFRGNHILKYAKHGFQGSVTDLERLVATGERTYTVNKPTRLRTALKYGHTPNEFKVRPFRLKIGAIPVRGKS